MRQQLPGELTLQFQQALVEEGHRLGKAQVFEILDAVAGLVGPTHVQVEVGVDAPLLELGDEEIQFVQLRRIQLARIVPVGRNQATGRDAIQHVKPDAVDAEAGQAPGKSGGVFFLRKAAGTGGVHAPNPETTSVRINQVPVSSRDVPVLARRGFQAEKTNPLPAWPC